MITNLKTHGAFDRRTVEVHELEHGWLVTDGRSDAHTYPTAADALKAIRSEDEDSAKRGVSTITTIEWETKTRTGRAVVRVLALARG